MAATKFAAIYVNNEGKIIEREIPGMSTYKIATKFAIMLNDPEENQYVWQNHGNYILKKMKKPKKIRKYEADGHIFDTFKKLRDYVYFNTPTKMKKNCYELDEDVITKEYILTKQGRRIS